MVLLNVFKKLIKISLTKAEKHSLTRKGEAGGRGACATGAWGVASRNRLGLVHSMRGFHRESGPRGWQQ